MARSTQTTRRGDMKSSRPILAVWLLERLTQRQNREALAGDLLEERRQGRSDMWFWRQVVAAITVNCLGELRRRWIVVVFPLVVCATVPWIQLFHNVRFLSFLIVSYRRNTTTLACI